MSIRVRSEASVRKTLVILLGAVGLFLLAGVLSGLTVAERGEKRSVQRNTPYNTKIINNTATTTQYVLRTHVPAGHTKAGQSARDYIHNRIREFRTIASESTTSDSIRKTFDNSVDVYQTSRFMSYVVRINQFTGGVNTNQFIHTFVEDKQRNQLVSITDVIAADHRQQFVRSVHTKLQNTLQTKGNSGSTFRQSIASIGVDDITNFYITEEGITVIFPPYTVAPGAAGAVSVTVPWSAEN